MVVYFINKINRRSIDDSCKVNSSELLEEDKKSITTEEHQWIDSFISNSKIPASLSLNQSFTINAPNIDVQFFNKGEIDKETIGFGVIIKAITKNKSINLLPISFIAKTQKNIFYLKNDQNLIGLFTPFHIILFNTVTLRFTQSVENEQAEKMEDVLLASYTQDNKTIDQILIKFRLPFLEPNEFVKTYYLSDFKFYKKKVDK